MALCCKHGRPRENFANGRYLKSHQLAKKLYDRFLQEYGSCVCRDVLVSEPTDEADVVFLLKTLPCLEQQEKGSSARLLGALRAPFVVASFPNESLGGRGKGMPAHYAAIIEKIASGIFGQVVRIAHEPETFYVLCRD